MTASPDIKIEIRDLTMAFGSFVVMRDINAQVKRGEVFIIMGGSGCGKSTLLRHMIGLKEPANGEIYYDGTPFWQSSAQVRTQKLRSFGVLFQGGALWSSMTWRRTLAWCSANTRTSRRLNIRDIARLKLASSASRASRITTRPRFPAACASAPAWPAPGARSRRCCSSMNPPPASTRSVRATSTS